MSKEDKDRELSSSYSEIEEFQNKYLHELNGLSKIFISLSIAILGISLSLIGPRLDQQRALPWIVATWISLLVTAIIGFLQIYLFSRRFSFKADYLHACMISDIIVQTNGSDDKLEQFISKSDKAKRKFKRGNTWCNASVGIGHFLNLS